MSILKGPHYYTFIIFFFLQLHTSTFIQDSVVLDFILTVSTE